MRMRDIIKNIQLPIDGTPMDFRLTKLDAFSGAALLQLLTKLPVSEQGDGPARSANVELQDCPRRSDSMLASLFAVLSPDDLRSVMTSCLNHVEVLLPAGYQPVMQGSSWAWPELEHDTATCLKLTMEEAIWTLSGFFGDGGSASRSAAPNTAPQNART